MRTAMVMGSVALMMSGAAAAQQPVGHGGPGAGYRQPGRVVVQGPVRPTTPMRQSRWGSKVGGKWWGGANAPGGWAAYRQPYRGYRLPTYWVAPRFYVTDWNRYGLVQPSGGRNWVRYYDDAVLVDGGGSVHDHRSGLDWDREDHAGAAYDERGYDQPGYDQPRPRSGVGGAVAGAAVGGVVGNVVAGRGNRLGGTLIGAGVGAAAGLALDRATDPARRGQRYDDREPPMAPHRAPPPPHGYEDDRYADGRHDGHDMRGPIGRPLPPHHGGGAYRTRSYSTAGGPVIVNAPYGVTTVTVTSAPVVTTTTTTEYYDEAVTWSRPVVAKRKVYAAKRVWRAKAKPRCVCR